MNEQFKAADNQPRNEDQKTEEKPKRRQLFEPREEEETVGTFGTAYTPDGFECS